ncbi:MULTISPECIES: Cdc6/Cdc18 family protein [Halorussus]|uniref:Cdc6/Cdc18 family protein n=1 Tax=Halorussus TaxID=1070314 RepID=UPI00209D8548|nr:AAA family ATPase [Halorussus vallis]USZ77569.1 AAA family ATPase [Halorussus vallis]
MTDIIDTAGPLSRTYLPAQLIDREPEQETLSEAFAADTETRLQHLHLYGPRGAGKTHLVKQFLTTFPSTVTTCYVSGRPHDTQYKALERLLQQLTGESVGTGHHVADLQRRIEQTLTLETVIVLDEVDFLLLNDGDDLLYFLTRLENTAVITVSANHRSLQPELDDRTYSSFRPQILSLNPYTVSQVQQILGDRARRALQPESVERTALSRIASTTSNIAIGLCWLRAAAEATDDTVTRDLIDEVQSAGYAKYVTELLDDFTPHHRRLYETIDLLSQDWDPVVSGTVYEAYRRRCIDADVTPLSERRISDFLVHLEFLGLIEATYHYGGNKGKTREIRLVDWSGDPPSKDTSSEED